MSQKNRPQHQQQQQINVEMPAELDAVYSNFAIINHSPSEIIIDFARALPNAPKVRVHARVLMTPMHAKLLHQALGENLANYEKKYGEIKTQQQSFEAPGRPMGFRTDSQESTS